MPQTIFIFIGDMYVEIEVSRQPSVTAKRIVIYVEKEVKVDLLKPSEITPFASFELEEKITSAGELRRKGVLHIGDLEII